MGIVYLAEDSRLGRRVALKVLPHEFASDKVRRARFYREAKAASRINHPNVAHLYEVGEHEGVHFLAMEFVDGDVLSSSLHGEPLPTGRILEVAIEIADALDAAHEQRIIHRDIKPGNIMVTKRGQVKLLDFGLAKMAPAAGDETSAAALTAAGLIVGTVEYMSPEQTLGRDLDRRSDIFSFGSVLYEMAAGVRPFSGATKAAITARILRFQPEAITGTNPAIPLELERIIRKCLKKDPDRRYQSARELLVDLRNLQQALSSGEAGTPPARSDWRRLAMLGMAGFLAAAAIFAVWWWLSG